MRDLLASERSILESQLKGTKDLSEWKRVFAVLGFDDGQSIEELAKTLRLSRFTIEDYLKEYNSDDKTKNDPRGGSCSKLGDSEAKQPENHLSITTYLKVKDIASYVKNEFGKDYSRTGMTAWLKDHGFTFKPVSYTHLTLPTIYSV